MHKFCHASALILRKDGIIINDKTISKGAQILFQKSVKGSTQTEEPYCVFSLIDENDYPTSSTITISKAIGISELYFCSGLGSNKVRRIKNCDKASVCLSGPDHNITLVGNAEVSTDPAIKQEMWYPGLQNNFNGPDDPNYCVIKFRTTRYNIFAGWDEVSGFLKM